MADYPTCQVLLDGSPLMVPWTVDCHYAARGALGIPRGMAVARELEDTGQPDGAPLAFLDGHEFREGERYVTVGFGPYLHVPEPREPWQDDPDGWKPR